MMSNPTGDNTPDATQLESQAPADSTPSIEEQLVASEKRRKDTQAGYTKGQQTIKSLEAENAKMREQLEASTKVTISEDDQRELDDLMYEDPQAWRIKMNSLEKQAKGESRANLEELTGEARKAAELTFELDRRQQVLEEFNASADVALTDEVIANDVPPRISKKLAEGKISFEDFLTEVSDYLKTGKVIKNEEALGQPNLGAIGGGATPSNTSIKVPLSESYKNDLY